MEGVCVDYILVHRVVCDHRFRRLEFEPFLSTWDTLAIGTLGGDTIVLCIEQELDVLFNY